MIAAWTALAQPLQAATWTIAAMNEAVRVIMAKPWSWSGHSRRYHSCCSWPRLRQGCPCWYQKIRKTRFLPKSIKIIRKNTVLTKFPKVRCPKGRSTALFACQKYLFRNFLAFLVFFLARNCFFFAFLVFLPKNVLKYDFIEIKKKYTQNTIL